MGYVWADFINVLGLRGHIREKVLSTYSGSSQISSKRCDVTHGACARV